MKRILFIITIIVLIPILLLSGKYIQDEIKIRKFNNKVSKAVLPPNSKQIGKTYTGFNALGSSETCGYEVIKLIDSSLSQDEINKFYLLEAGLGQGYIWDPTEESIRGTELPLKIRYETYKSFGIQKKDINNHRNLYIIVMGVGDVRFDGLGNLCK
jgi:hypothetical protein